MLEDSLKRGESGLVGKERTEISNEQEELQEMLREVGSLLRELMPDYNEALDEARARRRGRGRGLEEPELEV